MRGQCISADPIYPLGTQIFGSKAGLWTAAEIKLQETVQRGIPGHGVASILRRDVQYLRGQVQYNTGLHRSPLSWLLGAGFLGLLSRAGWRDRTLLGFAAAGLLSLGVSLLISADPRDLIPAIGTFALLVGHAADTAIASLRNRLRGRLRDPRLVPALCAFASLVGVWTSARYVRDFHAENGKPPTQRVPVNRYLAARIPCYAAIEYLNAHAASPYRAWAYDCEQTRYYARGLLISDAFSVGSRGRIFDAAGTLVHDDRTLHDRLAPLRVSWMILPTRVTPDPTALASHGLFRFVTTAGPEDIFTISPQTKSP